MSKSLVIVESPAKAKTINKYLGKDFQVEASIGHIKDLPKNKLGVDVEKGTFEPELIVIPGKEKVVDKLRKLATKVDTIYLAPDPDREGEAIAAHLEDELKAVVKKPEAIRRITFNEITPKAVTAALDHARSVDRNLVDAQQTRRVLDRIVGYQISPLLWDKVRRGLSAGRVQTVALRLIVEREQQIKAFKPVEYWTIDAVLKTGGNPQEFTAHFIGIDGERARVETVDAPALPDQKLTDEVVAQLHKADWSVREVERKERKRNAPAPFTTSKLQQDASRQLGFNVKRTMGVAQRLYEGIEIGGDAVGLITYMRTDSTRVAPEAIEAVRGYIQKKVGKDYLPAAPNAFKSKKDAQDAHEAIRPADPNLHPDDIRKYLSDEQYKLYRLIWRRFVASQMMPAIFDQTTVEIAARADRRYDFRVTGSVMKFDGFLRVYEEVKEKKDADDEALANKLPALNNGDRLALSALKPEQHYTEPPPRYNEASLVKELEERGIGRPSTYATIINTIQDREYVQKMGGRTGRFIPTEIGTVVTGLLVKNFPYIFDTKYTARLEEELDDIEDGKERWTDLLNGFYDHFEDELKDAATNMEDIKRMEKPTDQKCDICGSPLVLKWGKFGSFYACSAYDKKKKDGCTFTKENYEAKPNLAAPSDEAEQEEEYCENCGRVMVLRNGPWGPFMACPGYNEDPPCKTVRRLNQKQQQKPPQPLDEKCPKCGEQLVLRHGQYGEFISCSGYPKCKYIKQNTIGMKCPQCKVGEIVEKKARRGNFFYGCSEYPKCDFTANYKPVDRKCPECGSAYLMEKTLKSGVYLVCPNNKKPSAEEETTTKRKKKGDTGEGVSCSFTERIGDAPSEAPAATATKPAAKPTAKTHGPVVEELAKV
ncbi:MULTISPECIES: type I DNA topoisomerase [Acidobacterium]|uniref:DNA topoisomerase 1 n=1 Tax=Acidobacterium capsulatum (strain ATCC 51196 / DSM 11244 / BCRC 80197 / JCM 7670 / NBRC 15755 / NCIMB 13165 / 161) TaxID=240015 RepID=C1F6V0_ACIC5|nr:MULTISPECIES: type I DNA topoisomerase [Acidobacterium]ACO32840.1 DNA topoisomerase [Acidobacterium capsulatum ATCC 51196]HCT60776.1 type I DNA topoisomerase [Acidobacterium sp.]